ncbi:hypothetical protein ASPWEDRAFT_457132 [Aspergillus wentii DTO 134E9]|uniref:Uncharacterized protein n=1 Tax=Aspergillus wentii DTO 134E9 TaxID=1073089 RepID=A0A1L9RRF6_ASPWE|nr:uncharacterized protein ASPWEDRAFT_457132 [Aspergillus wentii DTO 134E9]OJJ37499.1 hypothetical protein ASPWEDRAFT_457132 [Aspergillus wentii DTO 134E9]
MARRSKSAKEMLKAAKAAADDIIQWQPWTGERPVHVQDKCNPWTVDASSKKTDPGTGVYWAPQVTAPMPLEALYSIMKGHHVPFGSQHILDGMSYGNNYFELVTEDYFQAKPNGIDKNHVTDDVLAFASLVLSYAKAAKKDLKADESPKLRMAFMPRTEFNTLYKQVKPKLPGGLFNLFNTLACYTTTQQRPWLTRTSAPEKNQLPSPAPNSPVWNSKKPPYGSHASMKIKSWIEGIGKSSGSTDMLTTFDKSIDGSIGGLGSKMENMFGAHRKVPLFEFRGLSDIPMKEFESWTKKVDHTIQDLHKKYKTAPE